MKVPVGKLRPSSNQNCKGMLDMEMEREKLMKYQQIKQGIMDYVEKKDLQATGEFLPS